ncbi:hypothetical protein T10_5757 [Trichinella papuae]|uniref:Uncharacterized protein n=1 Tax=Trichinella papuae TaxID=268474 RepID=A0A0V1N830_9BILA|nr:hypothetical protein T10_5757 [Trichinella papuae]
METVLVKVKVFSGQRGSNAKINEIYNMHSQSVSQWWVSRSELLHYPFSLANLIFEFECHVNVTYSFEYVH